jgi:hypothetical protein
MEESRTIRTKTSDLRVAIMCEDPWARRGLATGLEERGIATSSIVSWSSDDASHVRWRWATHLLFVPEVRHGWDGFRLINAARKALEVRSDLDVVAMTARAADPYLRLRAAELGPIRIIDMTRLDEPAELAALLAKRCDPEPLVRPPGVGPRCRPSAVLDHVTQRHLEWVFDGTGVPLGRRPRITLRRVVATLGDLSSAPERLTGGPLRDTSLPTWREVLHFVNGLRGAGQVEPGG